MRAEWHIPAALLVALALVTPALARQDRRRRRHLDALLTGATRTVVLVGGDGTRTRLLALLCAAVALALAATGPSESAFGDAARADRDILVVVDTSLSMAAEDEMARGVAAVAAVVRKSRAPDSHGAASGQMVPTESDTPSLD